MTADHAVSGRSHATLNYEPIPVGRWFTIIASPLPDDGFRDVELWLDLYPQVIAARRERRKSEYCMQLLFKSRQTRDDLRTVLLGWGKPRSVDISINTLEQPSDLSLRYTGRKDLEYIDQVHAHARDLDELNTLLQLSPPWIKLSAEKARYGDFFLNYDAFPPLSGPAAPLAEKMRRLDCVEFDTEWILARLAELPRHSGNAPLRRMEMLMRAHKHRSFNAGFFVHIWPTDGPVDAVIRRIGRMARDSLGSTLTPNPVAEETFGFVKFPPVWRIKLDLSLDRPQYPKS